MNITMIRGLFGVLMGLAATDQASAVHLDPGGRGQVLIYPYYTVNKQQQTLISVTNTSTVAQAVKVRFKEGYNGRDVRDFNVFLSPFDSWTGTVFALRDAGIDGDGAAIISTDTSCTAVQPMRLDGWINGTPYFHFSDFGFLAPDDGGPYTIDRTREGHIEIYAMADLAAPLSTAVAHGSSGSAPNGCAQVRNLSPDNVALSTPTGGLMGSVGIIDVAQGTYLSARAEALGGFTARTLFTGPENFLPNLDDVNDGAGPLGWQATARILTANGTLQALTYPGPDARSRRVDAVSALFMADRVYNEYQIAARLGAASDWLLAMPTKPFYTDTLYTSSLTGGQAIPPFVREYDGSASPPLAYSPVQFNPTFHSRNGQTGPCGPVFIGCTGWKFFLPYVTNVFAIHPRSQSFPGPVDSLVLGSQRISTFTISGEVAPSQFPNGDSGTAMIGLNATVAEPHALLPSTDGKVLRGLPVIGFWASNIVNNNVSNGVLANYAAAVRHATSVTCISYPGSGTPCN